jgi:hypothetical protein
VGISDFDSLADYGEGWLLWVKYFEGKKELVGTT